jgi:nucleoside-diphosphate-sugar epimerase
MKALVTGASGFVGGAICGALRERGHEVVALVRREGSHPDGTIPALGDLTDAPSLGDALDEHARDWVFHLAAEPAPPATTTESRRSTSTARAGSSMPAYPTRVSVPSPRWSSRPRW